MTTQDASRMRMVLAGSVDSSRRILQGLLRHQANVVGVLGLRAEAAANVSGYSRFDDLAQRAEIPYVEFRDINSPDIAETVRLWKPDLLFLVGLSQLVKPALLSIPRLGCIGFHPTWLPEGRGRAPIAWLTLDAQPGAATFFLMDEGVDSGPVLVQEPYYVSRGDYAADVEARMDAAIDAALDRWLPRLLAGEWCPAPQCTEFASYNGRRAPEDGLIDWRLSKEQVYALIRAASRPHPGAYTFFRGHKLVIWRAKIETEMPIRGVIGRIVYVDEDKGWLVQTGDGLLWLTEVEFIPDSLQAVPPRLRVGVKLGYEPQDEIHLLRRQVSILQDRLDRLERVNSGTD